jgi:hypothetical protein
MHLFDRHPLLRQHFPDDMETVAAEVAPLFIVVARSLKGDQLSGTLEDVVRWHLQYHPEPSCIHGVGDALFRTLENFCGPSWADLEPVATAAVTEIARRVLPELQAHSSSLILPVWLPTFGDLEESTLARLLHVIHLFRASGVLTLMRDKRKLQVAFEDGQCGVYSEMSHQEKRRLMICFGWPGGQFRLKIGGLISETSLRSFGEPAWVIYRGITEQVPPYIAAGKIAAHMGRWAVTRAHAQQVLDRMGRPQPLVALCNACDGTGSLEKALGEHPPAEKILAAHYAIATDLIITMDNGPIERPPLIEYALVTPPSQAEDPEGEVAYMSASDDSMGPWGPQSSGRRLSTRPRSSGIRKSASDLAIRHGRDISSTRATRRSTGELPPPRGTEASFDLDEVTDDTFRLEGSAAPLAETLQENRSNLALATSAGQEGRHSDPSRVDRDTPGRGSPMAPSNDSMRARGQGQSSARPEHAAARFFHRGWRLLESDDFEGAAAEFMRAIEVHPGHARYLAWYAWARFCSDPQRASAAVNRLLRVSGTGADALDVHLVLGRIYKRLGETEKAIAEFTMASVIAPGCPEAIREIRRYENAQDGVDHNS